MNELYDSDVVAWSERQAELLRRIAAGERVNSDEIDWPNVAEEIESVGKSETRACASHLVQALLHDLKAEAWPRARDVPHWRGEARRQRGEARAAYTNAMAQKLDLRRSIAGRSMRSRTRSTENRRCQCRPAAQSRWTSC